MLLHADPSLAEVPGFTREQLDALAHSVEQRRQQLEHDIQRYIAARQHELRAYEQEQLAHHRSMECAASTEAASVKSAIDNGDDALPAATDAKSSPSPSARQHDPEEKAKRTKHTRVQKREKELYGLVTPVFLPLLDARDTSPKQEKTIPEAHVTSGSGNAESHKVAHQERSESQDMDTTEPVRETYHVEAPKKTKRTAIKKSSLRAHNTSRSRRKRVSLVIDGQTVLPADTVVEPALTSPSETSASNSTTSLDDMIDPRLTRHDPPSHTHTEHHEAVHHSLPLPMSSIHSPTKPLIETPTELATSPPSLRSSSTPSDLYTYQNPPSTAIHTFLNNPSSIPTTAGPEPIYADDLEVADEDEDQFHTYVGGLHGSGADDVDQAGSYGYPSSLGASYLESYMQSRPLKVRMDAVERAGLEGREKSDMMSGGTNGNAKEKGSRRNDEDEEFGMDMQFGNGRDHHGYHEHRHDDDEMDIVGSMEGF